MANSDDIDDDGFDAPEGPVITARVDFAGLLTDRLGQAIRQAARIAAGIGHNLEDGAAKLPQEDARSRRVRLLGIVYVISKAIDEFENITTNLRHARTLIQDQATESFSRKDSP